MSSKTTPASPPRSHIRTEEPGGEAKTQQRLHAFDRHNGALQLEAGAGPFDQQALVLALHGALGPMRAHGYQPEQGVEVKTARAPRHGCGRADHAP